ncbi:trehalose-6-phosphate synthase [Ferrimicrobium sp.]|uniref:trehalose-6-phosphate synthase n=1 Tax=Ferrimicrobium sp. TaxID=2926050 RepID=UPI002633C862|nr:trehalose-6-phosphate synthase [Ferrimicrobium sp.]
MQQKSRYLFVTNRGPMQVGADGHTLIRSGGGLASGLLGLMDQPGHDEIRWLFPISSEAEVIAAREHRYEAIQPGFCPAPVDEQDHRVAYQVIANEYFWYLFHGLFDLSFEPIFDQAFFDAYDQYRRFNDQMANAVSKLDLTATTIIINDYHLMLMPQLLRDRGFSGSIVLFFHTPICTAAESELIPSIIRDELLRNFAAANVIGLHAHHWEQFFIDSFGHRGFRLPPTVVAPLPADTLGMVNSLSDEGVAYERDRLEPLAMGLPTILRVDRIEPSKNLLRGVYAIDSMLRQNPKTRGNFRALLFAYPSRSTIPKYRRLTVELETLVKEVNERWFHQGWNPIYLDLSDHPARSLASYQLFDTLLVNPLRDGLNLVVFEAALVAKPTAQIVLSTEAGAAEHVGQWLELINPLDIAGTAGALDRALEGGDLDPVRSWTNQNTWTRWLETINRALR